MGKKRLTSVYVDDEKMRMLKALGISLSQIVNEALDYAITDRFEEYKEQLKKRIENELKRKKELEENWRERLREMINKPLY